MRGREKKIQDERIRVDRRRRGERRRVEDVIDAMGLLGWYRSLPGDVRESAPASVFRRPVVGIAPGSPAREDLKSIKAYIEHALHNSHTVTDRGRPISLADFLSTCLTLPRWLASIRPLRHRPFAAEAAKRADEFFQVRVPNALDHLTPMFWFPTLASTRLDGEVFAYAIEPGRVLGTPAFRVNLSLSEQTGVDVTIDGLTRKAFRCVFPAPFGGYYEPECDGEVLGLPKGSAVPFLMQTHALIRLRQRLVTGVDGDARLLIGLLDTLGSPLIVERRGDSFLFEYRLRGHRVGYLIGRMAEERLVFTTFLFLTMQGTPEYRRLNELLRLTRRDIEYKELDRLETFVNSDVQNSPELVAILKECGCSPLIELAREGFLDGPLIARMDDLKKFLRLPENGHQELTRQFCDLRP